jgi:hypothetical protein
MYGSTLFLNSALEGGERSPSHPGRTFPPRKTLYPLYRRLGGPQGQPGQVRRISPPPGFDPRTVQPVGSRYTDYSTWPIHSNNISPCTPRSCSVLLSQVFLLNRCMHFSSPTPMTCALPTSPVFD